MKICSRASRKIFVLFFKEQVWQGWIDPVVHREKNRCTSAKMCDWAPLEHGKAPLLSIELTKSDNMIKLSY